MNPARERNSRLVAAAWLAAGALLVALGWVLAPAAAGELAVEAVDEDEHADSVPTAMAQMDNRATEVIRMCSR